MKELTATQIKLLSILGTGLVHSGSELGQALGISRSGVWKQINLLIAAGITINRHPQQGYQLAKPLVLLNEQQITTELQKQQFLTPYKLHLFTSIDSTNRYLKEWNKDLSVEICCSELQTQGRGRFGRAWHSPFGENIYCSTRWTFDGDLNRLSGLSLIVSLAVTATISHFTSTADIKIKWPNDVLWDNKKLCGSLIDIIAESNGTTQIIIGIGLNVNSDTINHPLPDKPWCSLYEITGRQFNRNTLIARLVSNLQRYLQLFITHDLSFFMDEWKKYDYLVDKKITITQSKGTLSGIAKGVNQSGQLVLEDTQGVIHFLSSGDTSLQDRID